jgi:hypothetical protein
MTSAVIVWIGLVEEAGLRHMNRGGRDVGLIIWDVVLGLVWVRALVVRWYRGWKINSHVVLMGNNNGIQALFKKYG